MNEDFVVKNRVVEVLEFEPEVNATQIGISVRDGVVTLTGQVNSHAEKRAAELAVRRVKGVKAIAQEIVVRLPADKKRADEEIASRAVQILGWNLCAPECAIQVTVEHGFVYLSGEVDSAYQWREAESAVRKLGGVIGVVNDIRVRPQVKEADIRARIQAAFERTADVEASGVSITIGPDGVVVLRGKVRSLGEQIAAENAALSARGVVGVKSHLIVAA